MTGELPEERLLELLGQALVAADPAPDHAVQAAKEAILWRTIDGELAKLVFDSANQPLTGVRSSDTTRQVTFRAPGVEIEMMLMAEGGRRLVGQLVPPQSATVELRHNDQVRETGTDSLGRFTFDGVPSGPVRIEVTTVDGGKVITEWVML
jgi:hypothetical protein